MTLLLQVQTPDHKVRNERLNKGLATNYTNSPDDLGNVESYEVFLELLGKVAEECNRLLKPRKYIAIIVGDFYHKSKFYPFHSDVERVFINKGFETRGITILAQNNKKLFPYGYPYAFVQNIHHQYIMIFRKMN